MAKISLDNGISTSNIPEDTVMGNVETQTEDTLKAPSSDTFDLESKNIGKSENDPNKINVNIADNRTPLVILFGPPSCGKTMTLVRLTRYLKKEGYKISPIETFRPSDDKSYKEMCKNYDKMISQNDAAKSTGLINFMLVEILKNGKRICQILEAPGEGYFDPADPKRAFRNYVNTIINCNNRKIWCIIVEPNWGEHSNRIDYVSRIHYLKTRMRLTDKTIFLFNKIDTTNFVISPGRINIKQARREVENLYPGIFTPFKNMNPITRFFSEWRCNFVPFQTGDFTDSNTSLTYQEGPREYPAKLWNTIVKNIRG